MNMNSNKFNQKNKILNYIKSGNFFKAKECYQKDINKYIKFDHELVGKIIEVEIFLKNFQLAYELNEEALGLYPNNINLLLNKAKILRYLKKSPEALACYSLIVESNPKEERAYIGFGILLYELGNSSAAIEVLSVANGLNPKNTVSKFWIAKCFQSMQKYNEALSIFNNLIAENGEKVEFLIGKAELLERINFKDDALFLVRSVLEKDPNNLNALLVNASINAEMGNIEEALYDFNKVLEKEPESKIAKYNKSIALLRGAYFEEGWKLYENRWETNFGLKSRKKIITTKPLWQKGKNGKVLVWAEQGIGDEIMFMSIINELSADVEKLWCLIDPRLETLFSRSFDKKIVFLHDRNDLNKIDYEYHLPMGSLPMYYRNNERDFANSSSGYLISDDIKTNKLKELIAAKCAGKIIGISWDSKNNINGLKRGVSLKDFIKFFNGANVNFLNLQYGDVQAEIDEVFEDEKVNILNIKEINNFKDIDGLASLIKCCDEVISIDNSTVHLSGALGVKTKIILQSIPDWRWLLNRNDSPWYSSVELIRGAVI